MTLWMCFVSSNSWNGYVKMIQDESPKNSGNKVFKFHGQKLLWKIGVCKWPTILVKEHNWPNSKQWHENRHKADKGTDSMELVLILNAMFIQILPNLENQTIDSTTSP